MPFPRFYRALGSSGMEAAPETRYGTVVLAGKPNAGKSTLLNAMVGGRIAIVSERPQSTRLPVVGLRTDAGVQLAIVDPPGLLEPHYLLQETMVAEALAVLRTADVVLYLHRLAEGPPPPLESLVPDGLLTGRPVATLLTASDEVPTDRWPTVEPPTFLVSAASGLGLEPVLAWCRDRMPPAPFHYDPDDLSTQPVRFFVEEFVREAAFALLRQELPYAVTARVEEFRESEDPVYVRVTLFVERESQKGMVIGAGGATIRALGSTARQRVEDLLGQRVYVDLWVKVLPGWRKSPKFLRDLGFSIPTSRDS